jgi:hypothetical protein
MDYLRSFAILLCGVLKRFYFLLPSLIFDPFDIAERVFRVTYSPALWMFLGLLLVGLIVSIIMSVREQIGKYNLWIQECRGLGWCYVYDGGNNPNGIVAFMHLEMINKGSEHCKIKAELLLEHSGSMWVSGPLDIRLEGNDPNKQEVSNRYTAEFTTFDIPIISHNLHGQLRATLILHCWENKKWVFGRKTERRHIELPHKQELLNNLALRRG